MRCPFCRHEETKVTDSRAIADTNAIKRRRECLNCFSRFTTFETVDLSIQVKKRDGKYEDFQEEKLMRGLEAACRHSKISHDQVKALVLKISSDLMAKQIREISSKELGRIVMDDLKEIDMVAYVRFACVYKRFKELEELIGVIQSVSSEENL